MQIASKCYTILKELCNLFGGEVMITVSLRFEEKMKKELDEMCDEMGMNITTFFMVYAKKVLRDRRIPFDIAAPPGSEGGDKQDNSA